MEDTNEKIEKIKILLDEIKSNNIIVSHNIGLLIKEHIAEKKIYPLKYKEKIIHIDSFVDDEFILESDINNDYDF